MGDVAFALSADELLDAARAETGLDDFGGDTFQVGLDRVLAGLRDEAHLNEVGRLMAPEVLRGYLVNRLEVTEWHRRHPEMGQAPVVPPIVMIGMGRTGTTILHDLLGQDPAHRIPLTWEVDQPAPPPEAATFETDPRIAEAQARIDVLNQMHPEFQAMHPTGAQLGQECIRYTGCEFASLIFLSQFRMPGYFDWLTHEADLAPTYRWHRRFLQLLQWHNLRERWVLKSGAHLWSLPALLAEYPDAWLIQTHRDPLRVIPSLSSLFATVRRTGSDDVSIEAVAAEWAPPILEALDRAVDAREDGTIRPEQVIDVQYAEFVADPIATIASLYDRWGVELTPEAEGRMRSFLAGHAQDRHGVHRYSLADTGLEEGELRERARRYTDYFDVAPEPVA
jgi:Sulfotransferase family